MDTSHPLVAAMWLVLETPSARVVDRVLSTSSAMIDAELGRLGLTREEREEARDQWEEFRQDFEWVTLLAAVVEMVEQQRGNHDARIPHWADPVDLGANGRLLYFYLSAICAEGTRSFLFDSGCPSDLIESTLSDVARHAAIHRRKWGLNGVDAAWWMLPVLRGELIGIGSLQFHRVNLGVGSISPTGWYTKSEINELGVGFRNGDESLGIHIPDGVSLTPDALCETIERARSVLGSMWPSGQRRLATCDSWLLDTQLMDYLPPTSNIIQFQQMFSLVPRWTEDDKDALEYVFRRPGTTLSDLPQTTSLERAIVDLLRRGGHWRTRVGWFDFD